MDWTLRREVRIEGHWLWALIAILLLCGPVGAGEPRERPRGLAGLDRPEAESARTNGPAAKAATGSRLAPFARKNILPRVSMQLEALSAFRDAEPDRDIREQMMFDEMSRDVRHSVERATKRAVKDFLMEVTEVDRLVERLRRRGKAMVDPAGDGIPGRPGGGKKVRFDVGFHRLMPNVQMRYGVGPGTFRVNVDAEGAFGVQYQDYRVTHASIAAGFDGNDTYRIGLNVNF